MKKNLNLLICMIILGSAFISCKKDEEKTPKDYLIDNSCWNTVKIEQKKNDGTWIDVTIFFQAEACEKDNCIKYSSDNKYEANEGVTKCDPADEQIIETGTWTLTADNKTLMMTDDNGNVITAAIEELTENVLIFTADYNSFGTLRVTNQ